MRDEREMSLRTAPVMAGVPESGSGPETGG
jgi:hypothetical protein